MYGTRCGKTSQLARNYIKMGWDDKRRKYGEEGRREL